LEASVKRISIEKVEHVDFCKALPVIFRVMIVLSESAFNMFPMIVKSFIQIVSEGFFPLIDHGLANGFNLFDHNNIKAFGSLELCKPGANGVNGLMAECFIDLFDHKADDIRDGVNFL
jgi:hypothetical protein